MSDDMPFDDFTEKIKILSTDDEKIKSFGEIFTNDSSRKILQLLFNEELSANQIAQRTNVSLQLVKYHINKLQDLGVVTISKIEKNSKSKDMKIYSAIKFSIVIVPPKLSERTKESKLLVRSFRHIYKVAGFGIATGLSGLFSLSVFQQDKSVIVNDIVMKKQFSSTEGSDRAMEMTSSFSGDEQMESDDVFSPEPSVESESYTGLNEITESKENISQNLDILIDTNDVISTIDLFVPFILTTIIFGCLTSYYLWKSLKKSRIK